MEKLMLCERLNEIYEEEAKKLDVSISNIDLYLTNINDFPSEDPNRYNAFEVPQTHAKKKNDRYILEIFDGDLSNERWFRSVLRHELYHFSAGHLDKDLGNNTFIRIFKHFSREWAAIAYQYLGVRL